MGDASADDVFLVTETSRCRSQVVVEFLQIGAADVAQLHTFEIGPDALIGVEVWRIARQLLQSPPLGAAVCQKVFDRPTAMNRRSVPNHQDLARQMTKQVAEELHHVWTAESVVLHLQQ